MGLSGIATQIRRDRQVVLERIRAFALAGAVLADLVDVGQYLGDGEVQAARDFLFKLGGVINRPRQRRRLQQQDFVGRRDFTDFQGQEVAALGGPL
jgi:hypothetical protein